MLVVSNADSVARPAGQLCAVGAAKRRAGDFDVSLNAEASANPGCAVPARAGSAAGD